MFRIDHTPAMFGVGATSALGDLMKQHGVTKAFFVFDPVMGELGLDQKVKDQLKKAEIPFAEFSDIQSEPNVAMVDRAAKVARDFGADGTVALGGGSSMDIAKCVGLMLKEPESAGKDMVGMACVMRPHDPSCPVFLLPTTAGTSSEVTPYYNVFDPVENVKTGAMKYGGNFAIIDPEYTLGLPPKVTAQTGMDLMAHAMESITRPGDHWMDDLMSKEAIAIAYRNLPIVCEDGKNLAARTQMSYACLLAGYAFTDTGVHVGHQIADCISRNYHYAHGIGCCAATPVTLRYAAKKCPDRLQVIAEAMGLPEGGLDYVLPAYKSLAKRIGMKSLRELVADKKVEEDLFQYLGAGYFFTPDVGMDKEAGLEALKEELAGK